MKYDFQGIEQKWQKYWEDNHTFEVKNDYTKPKFYGLVEFPYPSGQGLHVGHPRSYTALDVISRKKRMQGYNVLYPMGWDAFGLPTENYAIANKIHPAVVTKNNVDHFRAQLKSLGLSFDWSREVNTTDPNYYKWTQWIFLQLFKKGLAYKKEMNVNWCTSCKVVLANEEVVNGTCERCHGQVIHKVKSQWMLKITEYAQRLIDDLDDLDFIDRVKTQQKNWIGRSEGASVWFETTAGENLEIYTTRPDTLFGATYMVISPEHPFILAHKDEIQNIEDVLAYSKKAAEKSDFERTELAKEKSGVALDGIKGINPVNGEQIPIYVSDYVLMTYGTGAIMAVPAHDTRDYEFAKLFNIPMVQVVEGGDISEEAFTDVETGTLVNSGFLNGMSVAEAKEAIIKFLEEKGVGKKKVNFKLRDWVFSRQRYWGEPIPIVKCDKCGYVAVPEVDSYEPTDTGESPLAKIDSWVNTACPKCGAPAKRETDTMPQWAGSSWYFLRYLDPHNDKELASKEALQYWMPVDWYNGGMEHTTLHLLYSRFWAKFLYDIDVLECKEPYRKRTSHGMILGENNEKMSKSRGNVVNPDDIVEQYGADTLRMYEMFIGDFEKSAPWSTNSIKGCKRFLERAFSLMDILEDREGMDAATEADFHKTIKKVTADIDNMKFNTAIAQLMSLINQLCAKGSVTRDELKVFIQLLNPFAPHVTEEMWQLAGFEGDVYHSVWPEYDESKTVSATVEIAVQIMGKVRGKLVVDAGADQDTVFEAVKADEKLASWLEGKQIVKLIYVPGKLMNIVAK